MSDVIAESSVQPALTLYWALWTSPTACPSHRQAHSRHSPSRGIVFFVSLPDVAVACFICRPWFLHSIAYVCLIS